MRAGKRRGGARRCSPGGQRALRFRTPPTVSVDSTSIWTPGGWLSNEKLRAAHEGFGQSVSKGRCVSSLEQAEESGRTRVRPGIRRATPHVEFLTRSGTSPPPARTGSAGPWRPDVLRPADPPSPCAAGRKCEADPRRPGARSFPTSRKAARSSGCPRAPPRTHVRGSPVPCVAGANPGTPPERPRRHPVRPASGLTTGNARPNSPRPHSPRPQPGTLRRARVPFPDPAARLLGPVRDRPVSPGGGRRRVIFHRGLGGASSKEGRSAAAAEDARSRRASPPGRWHAPCSPQSSVWAPSVPGGGAVSAGPDSRAPRSGTADERAGTRCARAPGAPPAVN